MILVDKEREEVVFEFVYPFISPLLRKRRNRAEVVENIGKFEEKEGGVFRKNIFQIFEIFFVTLFFVGDIFIFGEGPHEKEHRIAECGANFFFCGFRI